MQKYFVKYDKNLRKGAMPEMVSEMIHSKLAISDLIEKGFNIVMLVKLF